MTDASSIAAGNAHTCAIVKAGAQVVCWGANDAGQLGDGTTEKRSAPVVVKGVTGVKQLALGVHHSCALRNDGSVTCWGSLGKAGAPAAIAGIPRADQLASMQSSACARSGKTVRCWGGAYGAPMVVKELEGASDVVGAHVVGHELACAILADGVVDCILDQTSYKITNDEDTKTHTKARLVAVGAGAGCYVRDDASQQLDCDEELKVRAVVQQL